jgi:hypothetical protein
MQMPPAGGMILSRVLKMVVAGVIGYPAKKRHPEAIAPQATASLPSIRHEDIYSPEKFGYIRVSQQ